MDKTSASCNQYQALLKVLHQYIFQAASEYRKLCCRSGFPVPNARPGSMFENDSCRLYHIFSQSGPISSFSPTSAWREKYCFQLLTQSSVLQAAVFISCSIFSLLSLSVAKETAPQADFHED